MGVNKRVDISRVKVYKRVRENVILKGHGQRSYRADLDTSFHIFLNFCFNLLSVSLNGKI